MINVSMILCPGRAGTRWRYLLLHGAKGRRNHACLSAKMYSDKPQEGQKNEKQIWARPKWENGDWEGIPNGGAHDEEGPQQLRPDQVKLAGEDRAQLECLHTNPSRGGAALYTDFYWAIKRMLFGTVNRARSDHVRA
jgi:hypothetical protein